MVARGQFGHDAAVGLVQIDLGMDGMRQQPAPRIVEGQAGFVAGGFDAEYQHDGHFTGV